MNTTSSTAYSVDASTVVIGDWSPQGVPFIGDLVELLVYDRSLNETELTSVQEYLRLRAGLPEFFKTEAEILSEWEVVQYELNAQADAQWSFDLGGTRADQAINADASILLSDIDVADKVIWGEFGSGSAPDFMGFVFGYQNSREFYLFDWKKETAAYLNFGTAEVGMRLTTFHLAEAEPTGRDFWASDISENTTVLLTNDIPWVDGVDYDFSLTFTAGSIRIRIWQGETVIEEWEVADSTYSSGRFGYFINSLQNVRFGQVFANDIGPVTIDTFSVNDEQATIRFLGGEPPYVIEQSNSLSGWVPVSGQIWDRRITLPWNTDEEYFRTRSIGQELSNAP